MKTLIKKEKFFLFLIISSFILIVIGIYAIRNCAHIIYFCKNVLFKLMSSISNLIFIFFIILFILSLLKQVINLLKERKFIKNLNILKASDSQKELKNLMKQSKFDYSIISKINIFKNDLLKLSFTAGLFMPKIYLSTGLLKSLNQEELKAVIYHEMTHFQKKDPLRKFFINLFVDFLFFLPINKYLKNYIISIQERKADQRASSFVHPLHLASALVKIAKSNGKVYSTIFPFNNDNLEQRLKELIYGQKFPFYFPLKKLILSLNILILIFSLFLIPQFYVKANNCKCSSISIKKPHFYSCCKIERKGNI